MAPDTTTLILSLSMAVAAGLVGCFAVMRRMTLAADAMSHIALPGIGIALVLGFHPLIGAVAMLIFGGVLIWAIEQRTGIASETIIGVVFSTALAVGSLMSSGEELLDALLGKGEILSQGETVFGIAAAAVVVGFILTQRNRLVLTLVSPEIARTAGVNVAGLDLGFLLAFAVSISLGLHYLGVLLMGSLIIIPAATAKRLAHNLRSMLVWSALAAVASTLLGTFVAQALHRPTGPVIIGVAAVFFSLSLVRK